MTTAPITTANLPTLDRTWTQWRAPILLLVTLFALIAIYAPTLLTQINGSSDPYMIDVGEIQVSLNVWGTIHATGYPLYAILGNLTTGILRSVGIAPAVAPCLFAMLCGLIALSIFYALIFRLTNHATIAAAVTLILGLTRSVWVYNVVSKEYNMNSAFEIVLLAIALWPPGVSVMNVRNRVWWLALIGGFGIAHHRTIVLMAPGLLLSVLPALLASGRRMVGTIVVALLIALIGFIPYIYLPLRAQAHGDWVYGEPGTFGGFWQQFSGAEANFLLKPPADGNAWHNDAVDTIRILGTELTPPLAILSGIALLWAMVKSRYKRETRIAFVCTLGYFVFLFALHRVVMPQAVAMPIIMMLTFGLALAVDDWLHRLSRLPVPAITACLAVISTALLIAAQRDFIYGLTHVDSGVQMAALAHRVPRDAGHAVMMMPWGPRFHAIGFSKYVTQENADLLIADHKGDFQGMLHQGDTIYTASDTFFGPPFNNAPLPWWDGLAGHVYLSSGGEGLIAVRSTPPTPTPEAVANQIPIGHNILFYRAMLCVADNALHLSLDWGAERPPNADLSVFVHLLGADSPIPLATADSRAPVYGWYPTTRWSAGELIHENYVLSLQPGATEVSFGMYEQTGQNNFLNYGTQTLSLLFASNCHDSQGILTANRIVGGVDEP